MTEQELGEYWMRRRREKARVPATRAPRIGLTSPCTQSFRACAWTLPWSTPAATPLAGRCSSLGRTVNR